MGTSRVKIALLATGFIIIVFSGLFLSANQSFIFAKAVGTSEFYNSGEGTYVANITDGNTPISKIYINIGAAVANSGNLRQHRILIQIPYSPDVELDSVTFRFSSDPNAIFAFYSKASSYIWTEITPHQENNAYVYKVNDLGLYGKYTVNFEFIAETYEGTNHLAIEADLSMHQPALIQLTSLKAHVFIDATIPADIRQNT
jgi:hypothetical protein